MKVYRSTMIKKKKKTFSIFQMRVSILHVNAVVYEYYTCVCVCTYIIWVCLQYIHVCTCACVIIATKAPNVIFHTHPYLKTPLSSSPHHPPVSYSDLAATRLPHPGLNPWNLYRQVGTEYKRQWPRGRARPKLSRNIAHFLCTAIEGEHRGAERRTVINFIYGL